MKLSAEPQPSSTILKTGPTSFYCHDSNIFGLSSMDSSSSKQRRLVLSRKGIVTIVLLL